MATTEELGKALTGARIARGLSFQDVERDTRISRKYLEALEGGELGVLPAPVYARAFMRTYAQYLGLNAPSMVRHLPGAKPEQEGLVPLPDFAQRPTVPLVSATWAVVATVVIVLGGLGALLFWDRGGDGATEVASPPAATDAGVGAEQPDPPAGPLDVEPGVVPDLEGQHSLVAIDALNRAGLRYLIIEVANEDVPEGVVFQQQPAAGASELGTVVTLLVSK